jgi:mercuric reductase
MKREQYDLVVIGAGSAARDAANRAAKEYGAKVALIEHERWGGSCPNVACVPTKAYLVAAEIAHWINTLANRRGIEVSSARVNLAETKAWKETLKKPQPKWVEDLQAAGFDTYAGTASFVDSHTVRVGDTDLSADRILIATGSRTAVPPVEGIESVDWIDHITALDLEEPPESLLVVGAGAVGLEFGQAFSRFGSKVTIVDALDQIATQADRQSAAELHAALADEGLAIVLASSVTKIAARNGGGVATIAPREGGDAREVEFERLLLASGRVPNIEQLNLEAIGVETSKLGIVADGRMRTSVPGVWAAGDVNGQALFTPAAQYQARIAVADMFGADPAPADYSTLPMAIFTEPELAGVGMTEAEARERAHEAESVIQPLRHLRRAEYTDAEHGLFKLVFDAKSRRVLGLHIVAPAASEVIQGFALAIKLGATVDDLAQAHHAFPTIGQGVKAAAEQARVAVAA